MVNVDSNIVANKIIKGGINAAAYQYAFNFSSQPNDGDTIIINQTFYGSPLTQPTQTYTFRTALSGAANEILIGGSLAAAKWNFYAAMNQVRYWIDNTGASHDTGGPGVGYSSNFSVNGIWVCTPFMQDTTGAMTAFTDTGNYLIFVSLTRQGPIIDAMIVTGTYFTNHSITVIASQGLTQGVGAGAIAFLDQILQGLCTPRNLYAVAGDTARKATSTSQKNNAMSELEKVAMAEMGKVFYQPSTVAYDSSSGSDSSKGFKLKSLYDLYSYYNLPNASFVNLGTQPLFDQIIDKDKFITNSLVTYYPRSIGKSGTVLAVAPNVISVPGKSGGERWAGIIKLPQGGAITVRLDYKEQISLQPIGALNLLTPLTPYTDYTINDRSDGKGFDYTNYFGGPQIFFSVVNNGTNCDITIRNIALGTLYITKLQIRGTPIYNYSQSTQHTQGNLILSGFTQSMTKDIQYPIADNDALSYTQWMNLKYNNVTARLLEDVDFRNFNWVGDGTTFATPLWSNTYLYTPVMISDPTSGLTNGKFIIIGYTKSFKQGGATDIKLRLEALEAFNMFTLDDTTYGLLDTAPDYLGA